MGRSKLEEYLAERVYCFQRLKSKLQSLSDRFPVQLIDAKENKISLALKILAENKAKPLSQLGSNLFHKQVSGCRVLSGRSNFKYILQSNLELDNFGMHRQKLNGMFGYVNAAAAIGVCEYDIDEFCSRLEKTLRKYFADNI
ncbi:hypothetical protein GJ496_005027 [Pomphorhynchus laevis]|nr:hypothetical protein GJ496_005027 [Pomphorhynchus laevis]